MHLIVTFVAQRYQIAVDERQLRVVPPGLDVMHHRRITASTVFEAFPTKIMIPLEDMLAFPFPDS